MTWWSIKFLWLFQYQNKEKCDSTWDLFTWPKIIEQTLMNETFLWISALPSNLNWFYQHGKKRTPGAAWLAHFFFLQQILLLHIYKICIVVSSVLPAYYALIHVKIWLKHVSNLEPFKNGQQGIFLSLHIHIYRDFSFLFTNSYPLSFWSKKRGGVSNFLGQQQP